MKTLEEVINHMKNYKAKQDHFPPDHPTYLYCQGVIDALGWAYGLPYWDLSKLEMEVKNDEV